jgi:acetyl-CoA synthetase (ADP-forming)
VSSEIVHKSDIGAVKLGLQSSSEVAQQMEAMRASLTARRIRVQRWLVEEMAPAGLECVVGGVVDPEFGPMVMAGLGGVFVEVMKDVAFRICPIERGDAFAMLNELRGAALFRGARGRDPASLDAIADALLKIGGDRGVLMTLADEVMEIDVNPLIVTRDAAVAVDARFILSHAV